MKRNLSRLIFTGSWPVRQLCTAAAAPSRKRSGGDPNRLYRRLSVLIGTGETVTKTLDEYKMEGKKISKPELIRCVKELRKYNRFDHALQIMEWIEGEKMSFSHADQAICLDLIAKTKGILAAENHFNSVPPSQRNQSIYGALLNCYCNESMYDKALSVFQKMDEMDILNSNLPYNNLMALHLKIGQPEVVPMLVQEMQRKNIPPCNFTYKLWMQSYGSLNDFEAVEKVLVKMKKYDGNKIDWTTYSNLATIYVNAGLFQKAEYALKELEALNGHRERDGYHFLISLYAATSNLGEVIRVWKLLKSRFDVVTNISYLVVIQALDKLKDVDTLSQCFKEWESSCQSYDMRLANVAIKVYLEHDMYEQAALVFNNALERCKGPFFRAREMFMVFFLRTHQLNLALNHLKAAFSEVNEFEWQPEQVTVSAFLNYFEQEKNVDGAEKFCNILKNINLLDSNAYISLLKTYVAAGRSAPEMRQRLEEDNVETGSELEYLLNRVCLS